MRIGPAAQLPPAFVCAPFVRHCFSGSFGGGEARAHCSGEPGAAGGLHHDSGRVRTARRFGAMKGAAHTQRAHSTHAQPFSNRPPPHPTPPPLFARVHNEPITAHSMMRMCPPRLYFAPPSVCSAFDIKTKNALKRLFQNSFHHRIRSEYVCVRPRALCTCDNRGMRQQSSTARAEKKAAPSRLRRQRR